MIQPANEVFARYFLEDPECLGKFRLWLCEEHQARFDRKSGVENKVIADLNRGFQRLGMEDDRVESSFDDAVERSYPGWWKCARCSEPFCKGSSL